MVLKAILFLNSMIYYFLHPNNKLRTQFSMFTKSVCSIFICIKHLLFILDSYPTDILKFAL